MHVGAEDRSANLHARELTWYLLVYRGSTEDLSHGKFTAHVGCEIRTPDLRLQEFNSAAGQCGAV